MLDINNLLGWQSKTPQRSMIRLQGTTTAAPNKTKTWTNVVAKIGNDFVYEKDAVLGDRLRVVSGGVYTIIYTDSVGAADFIGLSLNADSVATILSSLPSSQILAAVYLPTADHPQGLSWTGVLKAGDIVRCHMSTGVGTGGNAFCQLFTMTKVGD